MRPTMACRSASELDQKPVGGTIPIARSLPEADGCLSEADGSITILVFFESQSIGSAEGCVYS